MKEIFSKYIILLNLLLVVNILFAQNEDVSYNYSRSSIYNLALTHPGSAMSDQIFFAFREMPTLDKFNDHSLSLRVIFAADGNDSESAKADIDKFLSDNNIGKRMVAKWFNRDKQNGAFDMSLVAERGHYNASQADLELALQTVRGKAMLADAGEQLIGNTFVIINDITYVNKEERAQKAVAFFKILGSIAGAVGGSSGGNVESIAELTKSVSDLAGSISDAVAGFTVRIESYLYQIAWNDEIAARFYNEYYFDKNQINNEKKSAFDSEKDLFKLKFVGSFKATSEKTVMRGIKKDEDVFRKVLARAIDKNIVELQKEYEVFKVKVPIINIDGDNINVQIGLKEGVSVNSKYEVLEKVLNDNGKTEYKRVGVIKPIKDKIWDNRYMAAEEEAINANLKYTSFKTVSGSGFYKGMLIREIKY